MSFISIRDEMSMGLRQQGGILAILLALCFAGIAVADKPQVRDLGGRQGTGSARISELQVAIIAEELDLGTGDDLISKGGGGSSRGGRGPGIKPGDIGKIIGIGMDILRHLPPPRGPRIGPLKPPIELADPDDVDFGDIPDDLFEDDVERVIPPPDEQEIEWYPEPPPEKRTGSTDLLDESPGTPQTDVPPSEEETTEAVPLSVQEIQELAEENDQRWDEVTADLPTGMEIADAGDMPWYIDILPDMPFFENIRRHYEEEAEFQEEESDTRLTDKVPKPLELVPGVSELKTAADAVYDVKHHKDQAERLEQINALENDKKKIQNRLDTENGLSGADRKELENQRDEIDRKQQEKQEEYDKKQKDFKERQDKSMKEAGGVALPAAESLQEGAKEGFMKSTKDKYHMLDIEAVPSGQP